MNKTSLKIAIFSLITTLLCPTLLNAAEFNPGYVISDYDLTNSSTMTLESIQSFLERGYLGDYETEDVDGVEKTAAEIIYRVSNEYGINPRAILVMLQKEQSLIEDDDPSQSQLDWALGYGVCDDCSHDDEAIQRWRGFGKQVNSTGLQFTEGYLADIEERGETVMGFGPGITAEIDDEEVTFFNAATAALYTYTPHLHGNENFWTIWNNWFSVFYPNGSLLKTDTGPDVYVIKNDEKHHITSFTALISRYDPNKIVIVDPATLDQYQDGGSIDFPNYSLLRNPADQIFLIVDDEKRLIVDMDAFRAIGFVEDTIIDVSYSDLKNFELGKNIDIDSIYPQGALLQNNETGGVFYVENAIKHPIYSKEIMTARFPNMMLSAVAPDELDRYITAEPVLFNDGELLKADDDPTVYVLDKGYRRPIPSEEVFLEMNWQWTNIIETSARAVNLHVLGDPIVLANVAE